MTQNEIAASIAKSVGVTQRLAQQVVAQFFRATKEVLRSGQAVKIIGVGSFSPKKMKARIGRDPRTNQPIAIKATTKVSFTPSKSILTIKPDKKEDK